MQPPLPDEKGLNDSTPDWWIYRGKTGKTIKDLPLPPYWRQSKFIASETEKAYKLPEKIKQEASNDVRGRDYDIDDEHINMVNAGLYLRRPILVTGGPGTGKTSLAYSIAQELNLGAVLVWAITTRSTLQEGLYRYDPLARLHDTNLQNQLYEGDYFQLGPLGTALLPFESPRVLLIDEIDKSDIDLPNDLLNVFEEGEFEIPELVRLSRDQNQQQIQVRTFDKTPTRVNIKSGRIRASQFPLIIMTSNGEREFPPAFLRRCLSIKMPQPDTAKLVRIITNRFGFTADQTLTFDKLITDFIERREKKGELLATDQLLNAIFMIQQSHSLIKKEEFIKQLTYRLDSH